MSALLSVRDIEVRFGGLRAVSNLSFDVKKGQIYSVIGPNGAGKSTVFNCLTGFARPTAGSIYLHDEEIRGLPPNRIVQKGIARTFQGIRLFKTLTVEQNVMSGLHIGTSSGVVSALFHTRKHRREESWVTNEAERLLSFVGLQDAADSLASDLSYGEQRRLEIARALATNPHILLLDEPAAGMNPTEKGNLKQLIFEIRNSGVTVLLIEHDIPLVTEISDWVTVLHYGEKLVEGLPQDIITDPRVIESYLGEEG